MMLLGMMRNYGKFKVLFHYLALLFAYEIPLPPRHKSVLRNFEKLLRVRCKFDLASEITMENEFAGKTAEISHLTK